MTKRTYQVRGMHCASCEVLVERAFSKSPEVTKVKASQAGWVAVWSEREQNLESVNARLAPHGYEVSTTVGATPSSWRRLGGALLTVVAVYLLFKNLNLVPNLERGEDLNLGVVFVMGLVAAVSSCIAVTGGLLVAVSSAHAQTHPEATGWQKFRPHVFFNIGRVLSYTVLGAAVGALGSVLALSSMANGVVTLVASLAMILLGLRLLGVPWFSGLALRPPKFIAHRLHDSTGATHALAPFLMGAGTFFLPCGFTQALQLYVLTRGDTTAGAMTMLVFSLGTMPALVSLGALTSFLKGRWQRVLMFTAGSAVVALGLINLGYGFTLTGMSGRIAQARENLKIFASRQGIDVSDSNVSLVDGMQVVKMNVVARGYSPNQFTVRAGTPVRWEIIGINTYGCQSMLEFPALSLSKYIGQGTTVIDFTPQGEGQLEFRCAMGMYRGSFTVLPPKGD